MDLGFSSHAFHSSARLVFMDAELSRDRTSLTITSPPNNRVYPPGPGASFAYCKFCDTQVLIMVLRSVHFLDHRRRYQRRNASHGRIRSIAASTRSRHQNLNLGFYRVTMIRRNNVELFSFPSYSPLWNISVHCRVSALFFSSLIRICQLNRLDLAFLHYESFLVHRGLSQYSRLGTHSRRSPSVFSQSR